MEINDTSKITRRNFLQGLCMMSAGMAFVPMTAYGQNRKPITRTIPSSGERIPVIGMGTSRTFDVGEDNCRKYYRHFLTTGGLSLTHRPCTAMPKKSSVIY